MPMNRYTDLSGGVNTQVNQFMMQNNECNMHRNDDLSTIGSATKCLGYTKKGTTIGSGDILGLTEYSKSSDNSRTHIATYGTSIYYYGSDWTAYSGAGTGLTTGKKMEYETFLDSLFAVNGTDANRVLTAGAWSTSTYLTGAPIGSYIKKYHDKLHLAGNSSKKSRVWISDAPEGNQLTWAWATGTNGTNTAAVFTSSGATFKTKNIKPGDTLRIISGTTTTTGDYTIRTVDSETQLTLTTTPATNGSAMTYEAGSNWFEPGSDDGDIIKAFGENSDRLLVFKEFSTWRWDSSTSVRISDVGTCSQRGIVNIDSWTFVPSRKGIYAITEAANMVLISRKIQKFWDAIDQTKLDSIVGWAEGSLLNMFIGDVVVGSKSYTNLVVVYDVTQNNFWFKTLPNVVKCAGKFIDSSTLKYFIGCSDGSIQALESGNKFDQTVIDMEIQTKDLDMDNPEVYKHFTSMIFYCNQAEGTIVQASVDGGNPEIIGQLENITTRLDCDLYGRRIRLIFTHCNDVSIPVIEGWAIYWSNEGER